MSMRLPEFDVPESIAIEDMPDLLRHWYLGPPARKHMMLRRFSEVDEELNAQPGARVLDIGSAWGFNVMALDRLGYHATALDLVVDQFAAGATIAAANDVRFEALGGNAAALPFADEVFDCITMVETLEHIYLDDRPQAMAECYRVLRPGGRIVLSTPNYNSIVERAKRVIGDRKWLREMFHACYADPDVSRDDYHPYQYHQPMPDERIADLLGGAGFHVERVKHFLFMLKNTRDLFFGPMKALEAAAEATPGIRKLAATVCFSARK